MAEQTWAVPQHDGRILVISMPDQISYSTNNHAELSVVEVFPRGGIEKTYGGDGEAKIPL